MDTCLEIHNFPPRLAKQNTITEFTEVHQMRECQICAPPPCHLSCCIFSKATLCGSRCCGRCVSSKSSGLDLLQHPSSQSISPLSLLRMWTEKKTNRPLNIIYFYSPHHWLQLFFQQVCPANTVRVCWWRRVMIGQSVAGCLNVVRICVWPVVI